ncbi:class C sortase [Erysipelotrichaceae bacterium Oil+RF-744-GAM-WT-6]|uniref:Class C sortase n=1 Tax=Stecheria intestinalis TaxID=2606630 RepID=A0A7X2TFX0_9FIRM|nr:class C sortase [Stecheria intestinalis]MSS57906.1 class C sortase [Stecheria intestinalis]
MKKKISNIILVLIFLTGVSLLVYPTFSDWWNSMHQSRAIAAYQDQVNTLDDSQYEEMLEKAKAYNETLVGKEDRYNLSDSEVEEYNSLLDVTGTGIMGYVVIPKINVRLPIYHGTDPAVLEIAIGHIAGTSLPVGGASTHCVLSGHRGLPSAKLFTDIDQLEVGDQFMLEVLGDTLTYEVDQITVVLPDELDDIEIEEGKDLCTLVTCTPYGVNTHRLLVRGHRVETVEQNHVRVVSDAVQIEPMTVSLAIGLPVLVIIMVLRIAFAGKKRRKGR